MSSPRKKARQRPASGLVAARARAWNYGDGVGHLLCRFLICAQGRQRCAAARVGSILIARITPGRAVR